MIPPLLALLVTVSLAMFILTTPLSGSLCLFFLSQAEKEPEPDPYRERGAVQAKGVGCL